MPLIKLLLVDDEAHVRRGLAMVLAMEPDLEVVGEADDGGHVCDLVESLHPDVVVMDIRMPRFDGLRATRCLREKCPETGVVVLSLQDDLPTRRHAAEAGARAFVGKQESADRLVTAIREAAAS